jgi:thiol-disulfide isomerase/thioredoxin
MRTKAILASMLAALVMATGCAANGADSGSGSGDTGSSASQGRSIDLDFSAETLDGGTFDGTQLEGKPAVLWFWAPWCPTCRAQAPNVSELATTYAGEVNVVGVGGLSDASDIRDYAKEVEGPTHLIDEEGATWRHFGVTAQSTYVVLDADGHVVAEGYLDDDDLTAKVADLAG